MENAAKIVKSYYKGGVAVNFALTLLILITIQVTRHIEWVPPTVAAALFSLFTTIAYAIAWHRVAKNNEGLLGRFYIAASAARMMAAFLVVLIFILTAGTKAAAINFAVVFAVFYLVMLVYDTTYFAKVEKRNKSVKK